MSENTEKSSKPWQFQPGQSGNPAGRPKGSFSITAMVKDKLQEVPPGQDKKTYALILVEKIIHKALIEGNDRMIEDIWNYLDGLPKATFKGSIELPRPIDDVHKDESIQEDKNDAEPDQSGTGGNVSE